MDIISLPIYIQQIAFCLCVFIHIQEQGTRAVKLSYLIISYWLFASMASKAFGMPNRIQAAQEPSMGNLSVTTGTNPETAKAGYKDRYGRTLSYSNM